LQLKKLLMYSGFKTIRLNENISFYLRLCSNFMLEQLFNRLEKNLAMKIYAFWGAFILGILLMQVSKTTFSQPRFLGTWEEMFMEDFSTILEIKVLDNGEYAGTIKMFSGENVIQNDPVTKVSETDYQLTFYIQAKDTEFKGQFDTDYARLKGEFIFPDKSKHPIELSIKNENQAVKQEPDDDYWCFKNSRFTTEELGEDLKFLVDKLEQHHPRLYAYTSMEAFEKQVELINKSMSEEMGIVEYYKLIAPVVESVKCSHTGIRLPENVQNSIYRNENFFPLKLLFVDDRAFCVENPDNDSEIVPGCEILSINKKSVKDITQFLHRFIPSEGNNLSTKQYFLNKNFNSLFNLLDNSSTYNVEFVHLNTTLKRTLNACKFTEIEHFINSDTRFKPDEFFINQENSTGYLTVRSFVIHDINKYISDMDHIFLKLQKNNINKLVLDPRGNSGGHPIFAAQLFSYLTDKEFTYFKRNKDISEFEPLYNEMQPNPIQFKGNIYVLINGGCLSTTGHLVSLLKYHTNAIFIGEEPGSTYLCNDFSLKVFLPNTGIEVNIPRISFETALSNIEKYNPFVVDYKITQTVEQYLKGHDCCLDFVSKLITKP